MAAAIRLSQQHSCSFDHFVGAGEQRRRHRQAERPRGTEVNYQLELYGELNGKLARLRAFKDAIGIGCRPPEIVEWIISVGQQAANFGVDTLWIDSGKAVASSERCDLSPMVDVEPIRHDDQTTIRLLSLYGNNGFELGLVVNGRGDGLHREGPSGVFEGVQVIVEIRSRCWIE